MLVLMILAVVWAAVLVPPILRSRREGRTGSSVVSFRAQLSTLERATPGSSFRQTNTGSHYLGGAPSLARSGARRRRREILVGLLGTTGFTFLLAVGFGGMAVVLFLVSAGALGTYVYALRQFHLRTQERVAKVRPLRTRDNVVTGGSPILALRHSASN